MKLFQDDKWIQVGVTLKNELFPITCDPKTGMNKTIRAGKIQAHQPAWSKLLRVSQQEKEAEWRQARFPFSAHQTLAAGDSGQASSVQRPPTIPLTKKAAT